MNAPQQSLDLRQSQNLVMTPQLQQAIKLLQLSNIELTEFLESEVANNPLIELDAPPPANEESLDARRDKESGGDGEDAHGDSHDSSDSAAGDFDAGTERMGSGGTFDAREDRLDTLLTRPDSLRDHLLHQLGMAVSDPKDRMIGALLIDSLDEAGYLRQSVSELSEKLSTSVERVGALMDILKTFDPPGIFARDLRECLALQLADRGELDGPMEKLLDRLDLLAGHERGRLAKECGVNETYLNDMVAVIKSLSPKPASAFDHVVVQTAVPDVLMKKLPTHLGGGWQVELNHDTLPKVLINQEYQAIVQNKSMPKADRDYLSEKLQSANWLVRAMDSRAQTILKVASQIVEHQSAFFTFGIEYLQPLTLKEIAAVIDMHESTVSRVTAGKYIGTPRGLFELKFFFSTALVSDSGVAHSAEAIKSRIKALIDAENPDDILSDDTIVDLLKKEGIDLARRTVAKYRDALGLPSSVQRRKIKKYR